MVDAQLLTRGRVTGQSVTAGATYTFQGPSGTNIVHCEGDDELVINLDLTGAADADLAPTVYVVDPGNPNMTVASLTPLTAMVSSGPKFGSGHVTFWGRYDITALDAVRIDVKNANAGAQTLNGSWKLG